MGIDYVNNVLEEDVHLMYSTPSCYLKALRESLKDDEWPSKEGDFFPYASDPHAYWTGYYTSRPTSKRMIRQASSFLQAIKQITVKKFLKDPLCDKFCRERFEVANEKLE